MTCCKKCLECPDYPNSGGHNYCHDKSCPCHTPKQEGWREFAECTGDFCKHETLEKHYIFTDSQINELFIPIETVKREMEDLRAKSEMRFGDKFVSTPITSKERYSNEVLDELERRLFKQR